ncbi:hypothetical protein BH23ACT10_BH23ACT10_36540 [soil metagenome]
MDAPGDIDSPVTLAPTVRWARHDAGLELFARLATRVVDAASAQVWLVEDTRPFIAATSGVTMPGEVDDGPSVVSRWCQQVATTGAPLVIADAARHATASTDGFAPDVGAQAFAGFPLSDRGGRVVGALCAVATHPREWVAHELDALRDVAAACSSELGLRDAADDATAARDEAELARVEAEAARRRAQDAGSIADEARRRAEGAGTRLELLAQVTRAMTSTLDDEAALRRMARVVVPALGDWCCVDVRDGDLIRRIVVERHGGPVPAGATWRRQLPRDATTPLLAVLSGTRRHVQLDGDLDRVVSEADDALSRAQAALVDTLGGDSAVIVGLQGRRGEPLGAITLVRTSSEGWSPEEQMLIDELARRASMVVENARLYLVQRRASETLQASLLTELPSPEGLQLRARYTPALEGVDVGGDWYDAFPLEGGATAIAIGDVMGHDLAAAARMGQLRSMLRTLARDRLSEPSELLQRVDRVADGLGVDALATCVFGIISPPDRADGARRLRWSSAGHLPPVVLRRDGSCRLLDSCGDLMLGVASVPRQDSEVLLHPGDTVILVTDGLVETRDGSLDDGLTQLRRNATRAAAGDLDDLCEELIASMSASVNNDDVAVIAVRVDR